MYTYCKKYGNKIFLREENGDAQSITKYPCDIYYPDTNGNYSSIYGIPLSKHTFNSVKKATEELEQNEAYITPYGAKNFAYQYIRDVFLRKDPILPQSIYIANIDIETGRDEQGYSGPEEARCPITAITIHNISMNQFTVWGYKEEGYEAEKSNVRYINCKSEYDLLLRFVDFFSSNYPHVITGWDCERYDIPYIINRMKKIFNDEEHVKRLSPFSMVFDRNSRDAFGKTYPIYDIIGITTLDYLHLFKKFTYKTPENYKLNTVAYMILGDSKIDYSEYANLQELYEQNYKKFIDYNIKDVDIVSRLDQKLRLFDLVLSVAYKAGINYCDVVSPVTTWDVLIYNAIMDKGMVPPMAMPDAVAGEYVGAYVKEPIPGMYKWIVSCDLNSLYPHIQMGFNISPEKRVNEKNLPEELIEIKNALGSTVSGIEMLLNGSIDLSALKTYNVCLTPNGQFYRRDEDGFIPTILEGLYEERKAVKRSMIDDKKAMEADKTVDLSNKISQKDTLQMALKILMNSEYGALANQYFRYFDLRNAEAVTSSGQLAILWVAKYINIFLNKTLSTENVDYVIAIDTDSVYLNLETLVDKFIYPNVKETERIVTIIDSWCKDKLLPEIRRIYDDLASYVNSHKQKMVMAREVIADKGFWTGKKRYALNVYDSEGVRYAKPKPKIMGLECVRSSTPEFCRTYIKETIVKILTEDEDKVQYYIGDVKDMFMNQAPDEISFPRGVNNIEKWTDGNGMPKKGCPIHVRGAIVYNAFLKKYGLTDETIKSGDKIKFTYLRMPNVFHSTVLSYPPAINAKVYEHLKDYIDDEKQWQGTFYEPVNHIMTTVGWNGEKINTIWEFC